MNKIFISLFLIISFKNGYSQPPQGINYQGVARDNAGHPMINQNISIRLNILDGSNTGLSVYTETQNVTTNTTGLFNLSIGTGTLVSGIFSTIPWGQGDKWLQIEMDAAGGSNYQLVGTTQFLSVPYALYAGTSGNSRFFIGQHYAGGIIFYIDSTGQHGLVCSTTDLGPTNWGCDGVSIGGTSELIGTGQQNTAFIIAGCTENNIAAKLCYDLVLNGYNDWFLPSRYELNLIYKNLADNGLGNFSIDVYWSSSEESLNQAFEFGFWPFDHDHPRFGAKIFNRSVRAVRAF